MDYFNYQEGKLCAEGLPLAEIVKQFGTPCYVYSRATLERHWHVFNDSLSSHPHLICYAVKANSNIAVLNLFARLGSGFDIVSVGELERVLKAGGDPAKVVFSGVGKQAHEVKRALEVGIYCFNIESEAELELIADIARTLNVIAPVSFRVNPDVDAKTHPYISTGLKQNKFGIETEQAVVLYLKAHRLKQIKIVGVDCHIGSQITELSPFMDALDRLLLLIDELKQHAIEVSHLNLGGGLGVTYTNECPPQPSDYASAIADRLRGNSLKIILEPGRAIAANAGVLLTRVLRTKTNSHKRFAIVDAAMNDLLRPALYQATHQIVPVVEAGGSEQCYDVVGPICETADFLGTINHDKLATGNLLAVRSTGAYGFSMSSNYNSRPRLAEIMVDKDKSFVIRHPETINDLFASEALLP